MSGAHPRAGGAGAGGSGLIKHCLLLQTKGAAICCGPKCGAVLLPGSSDICASRVQSSLGKYLTIVFPPSALLRHLQIQNECQRFGSSSRIKSTCVYGGAPKGPQAK